MDAKVHPSGVSDLAIGLTIAILVVLGATYALSAEAGFVDRAMRMLGQCTIKGDISLYSGEFVYHLPGQVYYHHVYVDEGAGERWFCTEAEAIAAGWRKSYGADISSLISPRA